MKPLTMSNEVAVALLERLIPEVNLHKIEQSVTGGCEEEQIALGLAGDSLIYATEELTGKPHEGTITKEKTVEILKDLLSALSMFTMQRMANPKEYGVPTVKQINDGNALAWAIKAIEGEKHGK
jgi:hypothetical protein